MGGCYKAGQEPGSEICTKAEGGKCTACNAANGLFKNPADAPTLGSECILCWDTVGANQIMGVTGCSQCTKADSNTGAATCSACQDGYYKDNTACTKCDQTCATCSGAGPNACTSCPDGKYLKDRNTCVDSNGCGSNNYADGITMTCKACTEIHAQCTQCSFDSSKGKPTCSNCGSQILKTELDGTVTCVEADACATGNTHFKTDDNQQCLPCSDTTGIANCATCSDKTTCITCLEGYIKEGDNAVATCQACGTGCATCSEAGNANKCSTCMAGFFLVETADNGQCVSCGDTAQGGIDGCAECSGTTGSLKCTKCKPNRRPVGTEGTQVTCEEKTCEDDSACGGTAGACDAIVIGASGEMTYYCSLCGESGKVPIDGKCVDSSSANGNTCNRGVCTSCTAGYFLYMGGCYSTANTPGSLMCKTAAGGICTTAANSKYFAVPGASNQNQSVLRCGSSSGATTGTGSDAKAYVGVEDCTLCEAPAEAPSGAMAPARCTACGSSKKPSLLGSGCFRCTVDGCSHCSADGVCEACTSAEQRPSTDGKQCIPCNISGCTRCSEASKCSQCGDGYRLESDTCVPTGPNLSSGAIAGISIAVIAVVGGFVGFRCWWFICRGKA